MCQNVLWLIAERMAPVSCIISLLWCFLYHVFCIMSSVSRLLYHVSCLLSHVTRLTSPDSHLLSHVSCLTFHVSCHMSPVSRLLYCVLYLWRIGGAVVRVSRSVSGRLEFKHWMMFIFPKCVINTKIVRN